MTIHIGVVYLHNVFMKTLFMSIFRIERILSEIADYLSYADHFNEEVDERTAMQQQLDRYHLMKCCPVFRRMVEEHLQGIWLQQNILGHVEYTHNMRAK